MAKKLAKQIGEADNVATCVSDIAKDEAVYITFNGKEQDYTVTALEDIDFGHKIAIKDIAENEFIYKYGKDIGKATKAIRTGEWVHTHNVVDHYEVK